MLVEVALELRVPKGFRAPGLQGSGVKYAEFQGSKTEKLGL